MNEIDDLIHAYPARVLRVDQERSTELMLLAASSNAFDATIFSERAPFFWTAEISNSKVDFYYTHMMPSTLANFVTDARLGVGFLNSHRHDELPLGRSIDARMEDLGEKQRVLADFFTIPGLNLNGLSTDHFIEGVRSGIIKDTSVGLFGGKYWCDICKMDYRSWDCPHVAGMKYEVQGSDNGVIATVGIDGAHLAEVSAVYDGATPDATIIKAQRMIDAGELKPEAVQLLEARYRMKFSSKRSFSGVDVEPKTPEKANRSTDKADDKPQGGTKLELEQTVNQIREVLAVDADTDLVSTVLSISSERERLKTEVDTATKEVDTLRAKVLELTPQAKDGAQYRADLIAEALAEGVRAMGDKFNAETYTNVLSNASLDVVKQMKADWAVIGNSRFSGGRKTTDEGEQAPGTKAKTTRRHVPEAAYQS